MSRKTSTARKPKRVTRREPTPEEEGQQILEQATKAGTDYAQDQIGGDYFQDWVREQMAEGEAMRQADPSSVIPLESPSDAKKLARNMLKQLEWDTKRDMDASVVLEMSGAKGVFDAGSADWVRDTYGITYEDVSDAFFGAFTEELKSQSVRQWLADIVLEFNEEARGGGGEVGESRRRPMVRAIHGYNIYVTYPNEKFARKHESVIGHIIQKSLVKQYAIRDGYSMEYGPIDKDDYRRLEGIIYSKLGNAVRVGLVQVAYAGGSGRDASEAGAGTKNFIAVEFDLSRGERTDKRMDFIAVDLKDAAEKLAYTLNLSSSGWRVSPSGRTVNRKSGNIGWHIVEAGSSAARNMGVSENNHRPLVRDYIAVDPKGRPVAGPFTDYDKAKREADRARGYVRFASRAHERSRRPTRRRPSR